MTERFGHYIVTEKPAVSDKVKPMITIVDDAPALAGKSEERGDPSKRRQILVGARQVFLDHGFDAASMGAIARHAAVSKGTLYVYFKSKEELFEAIVEEERQQQAERIFTFDAKAPIATELKRLGEEFARFMSRPAGLSALRTVMSIAERMPELGARFYLSGPAFGIASLKRYLDDKIAAGELRAHDSAVSAAQFIDSCSSTIFKPMLFRFSGPPADTHIAHVVDMAVNMFLAAYAAGKR